MTDLATRAASLDAADPLARTRDLFLPMGEGATAVQAYLDGNSLGRPLHSTRERITDLLDHGWGTRLIRSWGEAWMDLPLELGDRIGRVLLGAAEGQVVVADSTTVLLYKLLRAAAAAAPEGRDRIIVDTENFPTDRYVAEGVAAEHGMELVWISPDPDAGVTLEEVREVLDERTAIVLLSHVAYQSAYIADLPGITKAVHEAGAIVLWDLCHSAGAVESELDANEVDLAVGCSYKFLNGGPGAPAFAYVAKRHQERLTQPIQGWMGHSDPFEMAEGYLAGDGMRAFISGTPPILGMIGISDTVELISYVGLGEIRRKSLSLGQFAIDAVDELMPSVQVASPRDPTRRGGHVTLRHPRAKETCAELWRRQVIPDFREPDLIRLGLAPLSTSYAEVARALDVMADILA